MISETVTKTEYFVRIYVDTIKECGVLSVCAFSRGVESSIKKYCDHYYVEAGPFVDNSDSICFEKCAEIALKGEGLL